MSEFSVFKSKDSSLKCEGNHSLFVPHVPLFTNTYEEKKTVKELIGLHERFYDVNKRADVKTAYSSDEMSTSRQQQQPHLSHTKSSVVDKSSYYKKYDHTPLQFKRKRIKDIDIRFTNTGIMSYCDYLQGIK